MVCRQCRVHYTEENPISSRYSECTTKSLSSELKCGSHFMPLYWTWSNCCCCCGHFFQALVSAIWKLTSIILTFIFAHLLLLHPSNGVEYCDQQSVCVSICPQGYLQSQTTDLHQIFCACVICRSSVLVWWHCDTICTSEFVDDVMFSYNEPYNVFKHLGWSLMSTIALFELFFACFALFWDWILDCI